MLVNLLVNDLSLLVGIMGVVLAITFPMYELYKSKQASLNISGDISSLDTNKILITITNTGKINTRISNISFGFNLTRAKWYKPGSECQNLYLLWNLKSEQETILASHQHISVPFDLIKIKKELRFSFQNMREEEGNVFVKKMTGWVYLPKPKKTMPKAGDDKRGLEVSDSTYERFKVNFSEQLETHLKEFLNTN